MSIAFDFNSGSANNGRVKLTKTVYKNGVPASVPADVTAQPASEKVTGYDLNGNITGLEREGRRDDYTYGLIDRLTYTYSGNRIVSVADDIAGPYRKDAFHFTDRNGADAQYEYDRNGNMTRHGDKNLTVEYNHLNKPTEINIDNNRLIQYTYSGKGDKLSAFYTFIPSIVVPSTKVMERSIVRPGTDSSPGGTATFPDTLVQQIPFSQSIDYCGNVVYDHGRCRLMTDGGYVFFGTDYNTPKYYYFLKDHQGNVRVVADEDGKAVQINHYYPFGSLTGESTGGSIQPYKYNGKELDRTDGLDLYDYGARMYDAAIARWMTIDPLCEKYYDVSPYAYCVNNPVRFFDKMGLDPGDFFLTVDAAAIDFGYFYNDNSIREAREFSSSIYMIRNGEGRRGYTYTMARKGKEKSVGVSHDLTGYKRMATIHTHGRSSYIHEKKERLYYDNEFSGSKDDDRKEFAPEELMRIKTEDIGNANRRKLNTYIATPNGSLQKYEPKNGKISVISTDMPSDPGDPDRLNDRSSFIETNPLDGKRLLKIFTKFLREIRPTGYKTDNDILKNY